MVSGLVVMMLSILRPVIMALSMHGRVVEVERRSRETGFDIRLVEMVDRVETRRRGQRGR